ncbi:putative signaling protein [Nymphon striatum]|nr:putative signaling protein [Nymphon striatum]
MEAGMTRAKLKIALMLLLACFAFLSSTHYVIHKSLNWLLVEEAQKSGMDWAHHIEDRIPSLPKAARLEVPAGKIQTPDAKQFSKFVFDILAVGNIYQIDYINSDCLCELTFGSFKNGPSKYQQSLKNRRMISTFEQAPNLDQPKTFAEVYHPVIINNEVAYVLRLLVNLEDSAARYFQVMHIGAAIILLLLALAFGYPARKYFLSSQQRELADKQAHYLANFDVLTSVANRNAFQHQVPVRLKECTAKNQSTLLFLVDIDNFKEINDFHGHHIGDLLLKKLANTLTNFAGRESFVARIGGDEFALVMCGRKYSNSSIEDILNISNSIDLKIDESNQTISTTFCVGLARQPRDGMTLKELMQKADLALYAAKKSTDSWFYEYDSALSEVFNERVKLFKDFKQALQEKQIIPFYQPLVGIHSGRVEGFEALARWNHPDKGICTAAEFHEAIADPEISAILGSQMLRQVLKDMGRWKAEGVPFESIGFNVSEADLLRPGFVLEVASGLAKHDLSGNNLAIEVTENTIFGNNKQVLLTRLQELRSLGCYIALDDFGTGYSSITHIKELPCTAVKIDKSFVNNVLDDDVDQAIIRAILDLGKSVGYKLVLEGVETKKQLDLLAELDCDLVQGYFFSRPVPSAQVPELIERLNGDTNHYDKVVVPIR